MNKIYLYGSVGGDFWGEEYFTASEVQKSLARLSGPLEVHINSGGGIATEGLAIYTLLKAYPGKVIGYVDSVAGSAASLIAMACDELVMARGAFLLIHDPAVPMTEGRGTPEEHLKLSNDLDVLANAYADIYASKAGFSRERARQYMKDETYMDGELAVQLGFADRTDVVKAIAAAAFDYRIYANAPRVLREDSKRYGKAPSNEAVLAMIAGQPHYKERQMNVKVTLEPGEEEVPENTPAETHATAKAVKAERQRVLRIRHAVMVAKLPESLANELIEKGVGLDKAIDQITMKWKEEGDVDTPMHGRANSSVGASWDSPEGIKAKMADVALPAGFRRVLAWPMNPRLGGNLPSPQFPK